MRQVRETKDIISQDKIVDRFTTALNPIRDKISAIYLFGSRCRDDWRPDSDYDFLIVVEKKDRDLVSSLYDVVMDILLDTGRLISLKIFSVKDFNRLKSIPSPFISNVLNEGISLGHRI